MLKEKNLKGYTIPIWLSNWVFKDKKGKTYTVESQVVKGHNKDVIFTNQKIVNKIVKKIIGTRKNHTLVPVNLTLVSQHGFGVEE